MRTAGCVFYLLCVSSNLFVLRLKIIPLIAVQFEFPSALISIKRLNKSLATTLMRFACTLESRQCTSKCQSTVERPLHCLPNITDRSVSRCIKFGLMSYYAGGNITKSRQTPRKQSTEYVERVASGILRPDVNILGFSYGWHRQRCDAVYLRN